MEHMKIQNAGRQSESYEEVIGLERFYDDPSRLVVGTTKESMSLINNKGQ